MKLKSSESETRLLFPNPFDHVSHAPTPSSLLAYRLLHLPPRYGRQLMGLGGAKMGGSRGSRVGKGQAG